MNMCNPRRFAVLFSVVPLLVSALLLAGCGKSYQAKDQPPVPIKPGDQCAVCGMYITEYPGPRGEAYIQGRSTPLKFGSTRDFFAYVLQPEDKPLLQTLYVQDTAAIDWKHPKGHWIDARKAWYVPESALPGAMGPTLASFRNKADAEKFAQRYNAKVLRYGDVTIQMITSMPAPKMNMKPMPKDMKAMPMSPQK